MAGKKRLSSDLSDLEEKARRNAEELARLYAEYNASRNGKGPGVTGDAEGSAGSKRRKRSDGPEPEA